MYESKTNGTRFTGAIYLYTANDETLNQFK